ncbi:MAG TPA: hypothetical protein VMG82_04865 [Candidatus Sulfotelmatobacter sp.]|nr:hypothetical protein [Candidatus Sulfotelmatobacter sp.]
MKSPVNSLCLLCVLCGSSLCFSLDREAFSITNYDLNLQIEPEQHRLGARGKVTLRNESATPQKIAVLQISSSLDWRSIKAGDKAVQFVRQPYTSDIDHTGSLSEAIVTLPQEIPPHATIDLDIAYEGVILLDATRLTRIGTPEDIARNSDWDRIDEDFTGLRGAGYVAWYPIMTDVANLSEADSLFEVLASWRNRQKSSKTHLKIAMQSTGEPAPQILFGGVKCEPTAIERSGIPGMVAAECNTQALQLDGSSLLIARYSTTENPPFQVHFLPNHDAAAAKFADLAEKTASLVQDWFGSPRERAKIADLPDPDAPPFESGALLLTPLSTSNPNSASLAATHQLTHASFLSFRPWIEEGLAHFSQVLYLEQQKGRQAALDYMALHRSALTTAEAQTTSEVEKSRALVSTNNDQLYRSKAMCVWWMLRDMIGDAALKKAIASYKPEQDDDPTYMPHLIAAQTQRDVSWFFDDWLYHDRGLPDFKVESAYVTSTPTKSSLLTVTIDNLGTAGAEVPVMINFAGGEITKRVELHVKNKITFRLETPQTPQEIKVNDGSVPESDVSNNTYTIAPAKK